MVGCVVVHNDSIIGEGFTSSYGGPHAEVNAVNSVRDKSLLSKATLYVTLEPCSHFGKTPPCADMIIAHGIPNVVIGIQDPHDKVAGKGIEKLRQAGCQVLVGVLEEECREHHKRFLSVQEKRRPYIILKWAETADGFIAPLQSSRETTPQPYWITNKNSRQLVHQWRSEEQAILVGTNTVLQDNPRLTIRDWKGLNPTRIVLDRNLKIPMDFHILDSSAKTIVLTQNLERTENKEDLSYEYLDFETNIVQNICDLLGKRNIGSVIVEGGSKTLQSFIDANLWDEARIFKGAQAFGSGLLAPEIKGTSLYEKKLFEDHLTVLIP